MPQGRFISSASRSFASVGIAVVGGELIEQEIAE
jgi:hypothetical protein